MDDSPTPAPGARDHFLALLGHEMRNPLGALRNALDLIERHPDSDVRRRQLKIARRQVEDLTRLVEDLLDASRIDAGKLQLKTEALDLRLEAYRLIESWRPELATAGLDLALHGPEIPAVLESVAQQPIAVEVDRTRLHQMVGNLLSNARKFTLRGGRIVVRLGVADGMARLSVEDSGCGMEPAEIERLFDAFEQSEKARELMTGGLGLGLPIVRGLARAHGGDLTAHSDGPGLGSCFTLTLPITDSLVPAWASETGAMYVAALGGPNPPSAVPRVQALDSTAIIDPFRGGKPLQPEPAREHQPQGLRILLIDDHTASAEGLAELLRLEGHTVQVIDDGRQAQAAYGSIRPHVIVCDLGLPVMDGYAVARALRADAGHDLLLIALSGFVDSASRAKASAAGFDHHLAKPVDLDHLLELLPRLEA